MGALKNYKIMKWNILLYIYIYILFWQVKEKVATLELLLPKHTGV